MLSLQFNNKATLYFNGNPLFDNIEIEINYRTGKQAILTPVKEENTPSSCAVRVAFYR